MARKITIVETYVEDGHRKTIPDSQFPGTVRDGETIEQAIVREAAGGAWGEGPTQLDAYEVDSKGVPQLIGSATV